MPHRINLKDDDWRSMDGWPPPEAKGGHYPTAKGVVLGKVYSDEDEKQLHAQQDALEKDRRDAVERFLNGID